MTRSLRLPVRVGVCAALLGLGAVVVWRTVGWVFPVDSGSMEPVIHTGDWLAVRYGDDVPELYTAWCSRSWSPRRVGEVRRWSPATRCTSTP